MHANLIAGSSVVVHRVLQHSVATAMPRYLAIASCVLATLGIADYGLATPVQPSSPSHSWLFDEGQGTTTAAYTGGQVGTLTDGPAWTGDTPLGYSGNNSISYISTTPIQRVAVGSVVPHQDGAWTEFSVSAWVKPDSAGSGRRTIISDFQTNQPTNSGGLKGGFIFWIEGNDQARGLVWKADGTPVKYGLASSTFSRDAWSHFAAVSTDNGESITMYVNGVPSGLVIDSTTGTDDYFSNFTNIGTSPWGYQFSGAIDEVAIWNSALSVDNVEWLGLNSVGQIPPPSPNHPGDFDSDGDVDGADFVAWQTHFPTSTGATLADGDADGDSDVDGADFVVWQTNFPFTPGPGTSPVPEPNAIVLGILGCFGAWFAARRSRTSANATPTWSGIGALPRARFLCLQQGMKQS